MTLEELKTSFDTIFNTIPSDIWRVIWVLNPLLLPEGNKSDD